MNKIPQIIHQIWSVADKPLPSHLKFFAETWKRHHSTWEYMFWDDRKMNDFVLKHYPQYWKIYGSFRYNIQRWHAVRYLILHSIGGMYVDFDSECFRSFDELLNGKECCFSLEPEEYQRRHSTEVYFNNALMASVPEHPFMKEVIEKTFSYHPDMENSSDVLETTSSLMLVDVYLKSKNKEQVYLIPPEYTSPLTQNESIAWMKGEEPDEVLGKFKEAYSLHYFFNSWLDQL